MGDGEVLEELGELSGVDEVDIARKRAVKGAPWHFKIDVLFDWGVGRDLGQEESVAHQLHQQESLLGVVQYSAFSLSIKPYFHY